MKVELRDKNYLPLAKSMSFLYIPAVFVVTTVLMDILSFSIMHFAFPPAYIFSLTIILFIASLIALVPYKWLQTVLCSLFLGFQIFTSIAGIIAEIKCMEIFSLETIQTIALAIINTGSTVLDLKFIIPFIFLVAAYIAAIVCIMWFFRLPKGAKVNRLRTILCGFLLYVSFFGYTTAYAWQPNYQRGSDAYVANLSNQKFLYDTFSSRAAVMKTFGSYSFYLDNLLSLCGAKTEVTDVLELEVNPQMTPNTFAFPADEVLGEGYNLITILMETFERTAINPITTPNLYEFMQSSCVEVNGYYSFERTCFSDYISQTGMHVLGQEYWSNYGDVQTPNSLANIFNRSQDYVTAAFHNTAGLAYDRNTIFEATLGFQSFNNFYSYEAPRYTENYALNSDELLFRCNLEKIAPTDRNFYSYVISASTHCVNPEQLDYRAAHEKEFAYIEQPENWAQLTAMFPVLLGDDMQAEMAANYLAGTYDFDCGFGALLDYLKTNKGKDGKYLIETTAIVMFGDHYSYTQPNLIHAENENPRALAGNRCPLIVYNPRAKTTHSVYGNITQAQNALLAQPEQCGITFNRFTSTMDIYPTICSLFGIQTDQQLTYGRSIFDTDLSIGVAYLTGYIWGAVGYDAEQDTWQLWRTLDFKHYNGVHLNAAQLAEITPTVNRVYASIFLNSKLYQTNGFKDLEKAYYTLGKSN